MSKLYYGPTSWGRPAVSVGYLRIVVRRVPNDAGKRPQRCEEGEGRYLFLALGRAPRVAR